MEIISTYGGGSDIKLTTAEGEDFNILNVIGKRGAQYAACLEETRYGVEECRSEYLKEETVGKV